MQAQEETKGLPDKVITCSIWARVQCILRQDYRDVIDKVLSGAELSEALDVLTPTLSSCVQEEMRKCSVSYGDEKAETLDEYNKVVALFNALAVLLDPPKFAYIIDRVYNISPVSVAELKGLLDRLCMDRE